MVKSLKVRKFKLGNKVTFFLSLVFLVLAIYYLWNEIEDNDLIESFKKLFNEIPLQSIFISFVYVFLLQFLNWFLEALKFKFLLKTSNSFSVLLIFKSIYIGNFTAFFTPERVGNFIGRAIVLKEKKEEVVIATLIGNLAQLIVTVIVGLASMLFLKSYLFNKLFDLSHFQMVPFLLYSTLLLVLLFGFFNFNKLNFLLKIKFVEKWMSKLEKIEVISIQLKLSALGLALLRYFVFYFQYLILANALNLDLDFIDLFAYVGVLFGFITFIPSPLPGNLGTREGLASFLLGGGLLGIHFSFISFVVWLINVGFSTIFGGLLYSYSYLRK